ncbi:hypothetical protein Hanom_Chr07g00584791 [Helianthus anomalus]
MSSVSVLIKNISRTFDGIIFSGITKSGAEKIKPVHVSGSDWKYISMVIKPPIDSPNKNAGSLQYVSLWRTLRKYDNDVAATLSMSPR